MLADRKCSACVGDVPPLKGDELYALAGQTPEWQVIDGHHIERRFKFPDFVSALAFVNRVGATAEEEGHHPDILLKWGSVEIQIFTHKINALSESDFILGAKIDRAFAQQ